jgi:ribosomal protein S26
MRKNQTQIHTVYCAVSAIYVKLFKVRSSNSGLIREIIWLKFARFTAFTIIVLR